MKDVFYFSHDSNARHDPKITMMRSVYGWEGYGLFWAIVEIMREQEGYKINLNQKYAYDALAMQTQCERKMLESFLDDCVKEFELFVIEDGCLFSNSLLKRMTIKESKSKKARESAQKRWDKKDSENNNQDANASTEQCETNANAMRNECERNALKERKGNRKEIEIQKESRKKKSKTPPPNFENWKPSECLLKWTEKEGVKQSELLYSAEACFDWAKSKGEQKADWDATIKGWIRRDREKQAASKVIPYRREINPMPIELRN